MAARPLDEVLAAFEAAHAAAAPVFTMADIVADPHYRAREAVVDVDGVPMQGLVARLSATPGRIRWAGRPEDADRAILASSTTDAGPLRRAELAMERRRDPDAPKCRGDVSRRGRWRPRCGPGASPGPR